MATVSLALTRAPETRGTLVQQGLLDVLLRLCDAAAAAAAAAPTRPSATTTTMTATTARDAAYALARLLIPLDPSLIFHGHSPAGRSRSLPTTIRALHGLLLGPASALPSPSSPPSSSLTSEEDAAAHAFDALRALTNLASLSSAARALIAHVAFPAIDALLWAPPSARVQQAAVECVCNLVCAGDGDCSGGGDAMTARFTSPSDPAALQRLTLLHALTTSPAPGTRRAAAGALAGLLSCGAGAAAFLNVRGGVAGVVAWLSEGVEEETEGMRERGMAVLVALLVGGEDEGDGAGEEEGRKSRARARQMVRDAGGVKVLRALLRRGGQEEEVQACLDVLA